MTVDVIAKDINFYSNFAKFDEEKRMVYGYATNETLDSQGEIVENNATAEAVIEYKSWANIREMHSNSAVGTAPIIEMKKDGLWLGAHIVDDAAWAKVKAGVYKGFSIGGKIIDRVEEYSEDLGRVIKRIKKYMLTEISLVDRPANPLATFSFIKRESDTNEVNEMTDEEKKEVSEEKQPVAEEKEAVEEDAVEEVAEVKTEVAQEAVEEKAEDKPKEGEAKEEAKEEVEGEAKEEAKEEPKEEPKAEPVAEKSIDSKEEMVSIKKSEYDALTKKANLANDEVYEMLKSQIKKAFDEEEPKELVQKSASIKKSIGELSVGNGGWLSNER